MLDYNVIPSTLSISQFHKEYVFIRAVSASRRLCAISVNRDRVL